MTAIRFVAVLGAVAMAAAIVTAFVTGEFASEGSEILALPWGKVTLIDLYVGLVFFGAWIALRERHAGRTLAWWVGLVVLGNLTAAIYLAIASFRASTPRELLIGRR